jgi:hypothetical protein
MNDENGTASELFLSCYGITLWNDEIGHHYEIVPSASADISGASAVLLVLLGFQTSEHPGIAPL